MEKVHSGAFTYSAGGSGGGCRLQLQVKQQQPGAVGPVHYKPDGGKFDATDTTLKLCSGWQYELALTTIPPLTIESCGWSMGTDDQEGGVHPLQVAKGGTTIVTASHPTSAQQLQQQQQQGADRGRLPEAAASQGPGLLIDLDDTDEAPKLSGDAPSGPFSPLPPSPFSNPTSPSGAISPDLFMQAGPTALAAAVAPLPAPGPSTAQQQWETFSSAGPAPGLPLPSSSASVIYTYSVHLSSAGPSAVGGPAAAAAAAPPAANPFLQGAGAATGAAGGGPAGGIIHTHSVRFSQADASGTLTPASTTLQPPAAPAASPNPFLPPASAAAVAHTSGPQPAVNPFLGSGGGSALPPLAPAQGRLAGSAAAGNPFLPSSAGPGPVQPGANNAFGVSPLPSRPSPLGNPPHPPTTTMHPTAAMTAVNPFLQSAGPVPAPATAAAATAAANPFAPPHQQPQQQAAPSHGASNPFAPQMPANDNPFATRPAVPSGGAGAATVGNSAAKFLHSLIPGALAAAAPQQPAPPPSQADKSAAAPAAAAAAAPPHASTAGTGTAASAAPDGAAAAGEPAAAGLAGLTLQDAVGAVGTGGAHAPSPHGHKPHGVPAVFANQVAATTAYLLRGDEQARARTCWDWSCSLPPCKRSDRVKVTLWLKTQELGLLALPLQAKVYKPGDKSAASGQRLRYLQYNVVPDSGSGRGLVVSSAIFSLL